jgi:hypothetical protein
LLNPNCGNFMITAKRDGRVAVPDADAGPH